MQDYTITGEQLQAFRQRLVWEEKSPATIEKYLRDAAAFTAWLDGRAASKAATMSPGRRVLAWMHSLATVSVMAAARMVRIDTPSFSLGLFHCIKNPADFPERRRKIPAGGGPPAGDALPAAQG